MDKKIAMFCVCALTALSVIPSVIVAASFDCGKATSEVEKIICGDDELSRLDESLNKAYLQALEWKDIKNRIIKSQRQWLKVRNACKDAECLKNAYEIRIKELGLSEHGIPILTSPDRSAPASKAPAKTSKSQTAKPIVEVNQTKTEQQTESTSKRPKKPTIDLSMNKLLLQLAEKGHLEQVNTLLKKTRRHECQGRKRANGSHGGRWQGTSRNGEAPD